MMLTPFSHIILTCNQPVLVVSHLIPSSRQDSSGMNDITLCYGLTRLGIEPMEAGTLAIRPSCPVLGTFAELDF